MKLASSGKKKQEQPENELFLLAINLTHRCNLACKHCYMDAEILQNGSADELTSAEVCALLDEIATRTNETMVVLTGGEPLLRHDLEQILAHGTNLGLAMVIGTNGVLLTEPRVQSLKAAGAMGLGISLDSLNPEYHDRFRGSPGSWNRTLAGMDACRQHELPFQVHFSITESNADELPEMIDFAHSTGAKVLNIFFLVCTGRGESMSDISAQRYEQVLHQIVEAQDKYLNLVIRARCAPHYKRIAYQNNPDSRLTRAEGYEGGGCLAGLHYCRITPEGEVTACPYIPVEQGSIRDSGFWTVWDNAPMFQQLRSPALQGRCGECEYQQLCGGCRARPLAMGKELMDTDPWCAYTPQGGAVIFPLQQKSDTGISWSREAEQRLSRVPGFLRKMVKKRAETYVREQGELTVTPEHMAVLAARRFGDKIPSGHENKATPAALPWTDEAKSYLTSLPPFLQTGIRQIVEEIAREEGRLEVNIKLLHRLEKKDTPERKLPWKPEAEQLLIQLLADKSFRLRMFVQPSMEAAAEREAEQRHATIVSARDIRSIANTTDVAWEPNALKRVESAPDFIRAGIKKAAEWGARREGLKTISSEDLTRFRNRAMMRAVRRMKGFGLQEMSFDAFEIARRRVPRLQANNQAKQRFAAIKKHVETHQKPEGGVGLLDKNMLEQMKAELKKQ